MNVEDALAQRARRLLAPLTRLLVALHVRPTSVSVFGLCVVAVGASLLLADMSRPVAYAVMAAGSAMDLLDGEVARLSRTSLPVGALIDSLCDRVAEFMLYSSVAFAASEESPRAVAILVWVLFGVSYICSYIAVWATPDTPRAAGGPLSRGVRVAVVLLSAEIAHIGIWPLALGLLSIGIAGSLATLVLRLRQAYSRLTGEDRA